MPNEPQKFWNFSLQLYGTKGVAAACLELQDSYQLDVNLILFCFWHGRAYGAIDQELLLKVIELSRKWGAHVVQPLRSARNWMKLNPHPNDQFDSLRERIKADELMAEKFQTEQIAGLTKAFNEGRQCVFGNDDTGENIESLLAATGIERDKKITSALEIIRSAIQG